MKLVGKTRARQRVRRVHDCLEIVRCAFPREWTREESRQLHEGFELLLEDWEASDAATPE